MTTTLQTMVFIVIFFLFSISLYAQKDLNQSELKIIKVDLDKKTITEPFPYDENFQLEINSKKNKISNLAKVYQVIHVNRVQIPFRGYRKYYKKSRNERKKKKGKESIDTELKWDNLTEIGQKEFDVQQVNDSLFRAFLEPLLPSRSFELNFKVNLNDEQLSTFYEIICLMEGKSQFMEGGVAKKEKPEEIFNKKIAPIETSVKRDIPDKFNQLGKYSDLKNILVTIKDYKKGLNGLECLYEGIKIDEIKNISTKYRAKEMSIEKATDILFEFVENNNIKNKPCGETEKNTLEEISKGFRVFSQPDSKKIESGEILKRLKNIDANLNKIKILEKELRGLVVSYPKDSELIGVYGKIKRYRITLATNLKKIKSVNDNISKELNKYFSYSKTITGRTQNASDKESGLTYLQSDIGYISSSVKSSQNPSEYIGSLYLGLNWHIGGYNKNKAVASVHRKRIWYYTSLSFGVTTSSLSETPGFDDLFGEISPAVGINLRIANNARVGFGGLFLREDRNPIIGSERVIVAPYVSLSFNAGILKDIALITRLTSN